MSSLMLRVAALMFPLLFLTSCFPRKPPADFSPTVREFVYSSLALTPAGATAAGYHRHNNIPLDELLDDYSPAGINGQRAFYRSFRERLEREAQAESLHPEDRADYDIMRNQIELALFELDTLQNYRHNPTVYVELVGNALFSPYVLEYASLSDRYRHIVARLNKVPALIEQAKTQLADSPEVWNTVAQEENGGNIALIDGLLRQKSPSHLRPEYDTAAAAALAALRSFNEYLKRDLAGRPAGWQLGKEKYSRKFRLALGVEAAPEQILAEAEAKFAEMRAEMTRLAADTGGDVARKLQLVSARHATPETYFADARRDLDEARNFVRAKNLLPLPRRDNLQVIETPEFMRGIYSVGGFSPAPPLEPHLGAFYWLTPIPADWPKARIESKLREYNYHGLKLLTMHEAMPGHYVQFEYANDVQPAGRRLLRAVFGNGPYVEGWAVYATQMMLDNGYLDGSSELRLIFLKQQLRMLANAILDIRLHTMNMTGEEALTLMTKQAFQETEEATAKLRRAKLSSCQLPAYFVGWREWTRLRAASKLPLAEFHRKALEPGAVPLPVLERLLR